jgi:hypothetical protein
LVLDHKSEQLAHVAVEFRERDGLIAAGKIAPNAQRQAEEAEERQRQSEQRLKALKVQNEEANELRRVSAAITASCWCLTISLNNSRMWL